MFGLLPDLKLTSRLTFLQAADSAPLLTQFRVVATLSPPSSGGFDGDQRLLHRHTEFQFLGMLPPLRRPARWITFRESHKGMTNAIESANHIGNAPPIWRPQGAPSSLRDRSDCVFLIKTYIIYWY